MKTKMVLLFFLFGCSKMCHAQFISGDDKLHFATGALISATTYTIVYSTIKKKKKAFWWGLGSSVLAGVAKEVYDSTKENNKFDTGEWVATSLGGLTATVTIHLFVEKRKNKHISFLPVH